MHSHADPLDVWKGLAVAALLTAVFFAILATVAALGVSG